MKVYVLRCEGGKENEVIRLLTKKDITAYCPSQIFQIRQKQKYKEVEKKIFPGYVFVLCNMDNRIYYEILNTQFVFHFLLPGNPMSLSEKEMEFILYLSNNGKPLPLFESAEDSKLKDIKIKKVDKRQGKIVASVSLIREETDIVLGIKRH